MLKHMLTNARFRQCIVFFSVFVIAAFTLGGNLTVGAPDAALVQGYTTSAGAGGQAWVAEAAISGSAYSGSLANVSSRNREELDNDINWSGNLTADPPATADFAVDDPDNSVENGVDVIVVPEENLHEEDPVEARYTEDATETASMPDLTSPGIASFEIAEEATIEASQTSFYYHPSIPISEDLQRFTYERCNDIGLEYTLVLALMWRESRFQVSAVNLNLNGTRDSGVMQINDVNKSWLRKELGITDLMDPYQNIIAGTEILGRYSSKYGIQNGLMAYQYGEQGMLRKLEQGTTSNKQIQQLYDKQAEFDALLGIASA